MTPSTSVEAPPKTDGRRAKGDLSRAKIIKAALEIASRASLNALTIGQVAESAAVSKGHVAVLFGNRENLQLATLEAALEIFHNSVQIKVEQAEDPAEKLKRYCLGWFDYVSRRVLPGGCFVAATSSEFRVESGKIRDRLVDLRKRQRAKLTAMIEALKKESIVTISRPTDELVSSILIHQAGANIATFLDDEAAFEHAKKATLDLVKGLSPGTARKRGTI